MRYLVKHLIQALSDVVVDVPSYCSKKRRSGRHPIQDTGRFDNLHLYKAWYVTAEATSAIGESFADTRAWAHAMFTFPQIPAARRALGTYRLPDDLPYVDLDDPQRLVELGVRPSQVVERNRPYTQGLAAWIYGMGI